MLRQTDARLRTWAYVDGTTYYLSRSAAELLDDERRRLGAYSWREASGKDGLYSDNVGPSLYAGNQGQPVKVWGLLARGKLCIHVLPVGSSGAGTAHMNGPRFRRMIEKHSARWLRCCFGRRVPKRVPLIMDHERCLRTSESSKCLRKHRLHTVPAHPKHSADLNAIENIWAFVRRALDANAPTGREGRAAFVRRLRATVRSLNRRRSSEFQALCSNQKARARAVLALSGAVTKW